MKEKIHTTTAAVPVGRSPGRSLFRVPSGTYAGRLVALFQVAPGEIAYAWADRPYASWTEPLVVTDDAADQAFDAAMDPDGNIYLVYIEAATGFLRARRLAFSSGVWSVPGAVTVFSAGSTADPNVAVTPSGRLYVCFTHVDSGVHTLRVKSSDDDGATWGSGPADSGDPLTAGASGAFGKLVAGSSELFAIYTNGGLDISMRSRPFLDGSWSPAFQIAAGTLFDEHFDAACADDGRLGVVWDHDGLAYREYDGSSWAPAVTVDSDPASSPQLAFRNGVPVIAWLNTIGTDQHVLTFSLWQDGSFTAPAYLDQQARPFDDVLLYASLTSAYADRTAEAAGAAPADVTHPDTGCLLSQTGDCLFLGMDRPFRFVRLLLSTAGAGGAVACSYWDGGRWQAFTPANGSVDASDLDADILLWEDYNAIPSDWQKTSLNDLYHFWLKMEVTSDFATPPVGSRVTAVSNVHAISVRR